MENTMKLVSFDIFDTTLVRKCGAPENIFYLLANRIFGSSDKCAAYRNSFFLWRRKAEGRSGRRTGRFLELVRKYRDKIQADLSDDSKLYPEDLWLHYELKGQDRLSVPSWKEALGFAFEQNPETSFRLNGGRLPFGCHAWYHPDYRELWKTYIF